MDSQDDNRMKAAALSALTPLSGASERVEEARVDEIQIPRRAPVRGAEVDHKLSGNAGLERAWERLEKNHKDFKYQVEAPKSGESPIKRALRGVEQIMRDNEPPLERPPAADTSWIYGGADDGRGTVDAEDVEFSEAPANSAPKRPDEQPPVFAVFDRIGETLRIELAWTIETSSGAKHRDRAIELELGSVDALEGLREMRSIVDSHRIFVWDVQGFFRAIQPHLDGNPSAELGPLHLWGGFSGLRTYATNLYGVGDFESHRLTVDTLLRRFPTTLESHRAAPRAFQLLRLHGRMMMEMVNRTKGRDVAPLELDPETPR